ncbi:hypothetical protein ACFVUS_26205 [Nocardia sp. NPDC058058]|uniref:hypothetical protein n=1 Tax=Nocardia sp. NPDC058058 TaxID=3346317 RepID=UPI0036DEC1C0
MDRPRIDVRRILDDALWVLIGALCAFVVAVGGIWWLLANLNTTVRTPQWDGEVPFIADCSPGTPCVIKSLPEQTPPLATRNNLPVISSSPQPEIAGLRTGDRVTCTVHVELAEPENENGYSRGISTVTDCRRA